MSIDLCMALASHSFCLPIPSLLPQSPNMAYLRFNQHQINKHNHKIMLDVFIRKPFTVRALREAHTFAEGAVVGF